MTLTLHSQISGPESATGNAGEALPVILLHGLFGSLENLGVVARRLSQTHPVHSLDLRNHGRSPHAPGMTYREMAADVGAYMDRQQLPQAALLGHSMGGKVAMQLALDTPARVAKLIVADIAPVAYAPHHDQVLAGLRALELSALKSRSEADKALQSYVAEAPVRQFLLKNLQKEAAGGFSWRFNLDAIEDQYAEILAGPNVGENAGESTGESAEERAGVSGGQAYSGPTLFIKGGESDYIQEEHREQVAQLFPQASLRVIAGAGHWLHAEKPDTFVTLCERFLAGEV